MVAVCGAEQQMCEIDEGLAYYQAETFYEPEAEPLALVPTDEDPNAAWDWLPADYWETARV